jgi:Tfp pilus assembly protein PilN
MIKINLIESVTDRSPSVAFVEDKVSSPGTQTLLLGIIVIGLLILGIGYDYVSANSEHVTKTQELEKQKRTNEQMLVVKKEQADLEKKMADINLRIDAIQKLRVSQQGPGAVLTEITRRFESIPGLYLKSVEQKDNELIIKGESPNEAAVTRFGQSMEFSSGLFTNLNIETQREVPQVVKTAGTSATSPAATAATVATIIPDETQPEVVNFTIKCTYSRGGQINTPPTPANQVAKSN